MAPIIRPVPALTFDDAKHVYAINGRPASGVTGILSRLGIIDTDWYNETARERGRLVHLILYYMKAHGGVDPKTIDERLMPFVTAAESFWRDWRVERLHAEVRVCDDVLGYAGTLDDIGRIGVRADRYAIIDYKTGSLQPWTALQLGAYAMAVRRTGLGFYSQPNTTACAHFPLPQTAGDYRLGVELRGDGTYRVHEYTDPRDGAVFTNALSLDGWLRNARGRVKQGHNAIPY